MNTTLSEIMPYYNKLYASALLELDPFTDTDYTRTGTRAGTQDEKSQSTYSDQGAIESETETSDSGSTTTTDTITDTGNNTSYDLYSDTPQGALNGVENQTYLTDARKKTDSVTNSRSATSRGTDSKTGDSTTTTTDTKSGERTDKKNSDSAENYYERIAGKMASTSYSELLQKFRDTFINIDMMVIKEFEDCFMKLW